MKIYTYLIILSFIVYSNISISCDVNSPRVKSWAFKLNANTSEKSIREVCAIVSAIDEHIISAQNLISKIASDTVKYQEKTGNDGLIEQVIQSYFINGWVTVQVYHSYTDAKRHQPPDEIAIRTYLQGLANLTYKGIYGTVKLVYDQENMRLIRITPSDYSDDAFEFDVLACALKKCCSSGSGFTKTLLY